MGDDLLVLCNEQEARENSKKLVDRRRISNRTIERDVVGSSISRISLEFIIPRSRQPRFSRRRVD